MSRGLGSKFVLFYVGKDGEEVSVHEKKLCEHSKLFREALELPNDRFLPFLREAKALGQETTLHAETGGICLHHNHYHPQDMGNLVSYMYTSTLPAMASFKDFHGLYNLASKFGIPELSNKIMDSFQEQHQASGKGFEPKDVVTIYTQRFVGDSKLWKYCAAQVIGILFWGKAKGEWGAELREVCRKNYGLGKELFQVLLEDGREIHKSEASHRKRIKREAFGPCHYHIHAPGQTCASIAEEAEALAKAAEETTKKKSKKSNARMGASKKKAAREQSEIATPAAPRTMRTTGFRGRGRGWNHWRSSTNRTPLVIDRFPYH